ncbi:phosphoadenylyl-sulfate reductase [Candidatus Marinamargulisbacteria bacterium SCGC AG-414-C22]|nr:phosphoadenylyl-sulfate reductase [Candidatus Marinamargulisbacteria bacterium SCGC AG-414-C22]
MNTKKENAIKLCEELNTLFNQASPQEVLTYANDRFKTKLVLASSLGLEDQLLTSYLCQINPQARIFVLDTGRLNKETYDVMETTKQTYNMSYEVYQPNPQAIDVFIKTKGLDSFYESLANRKECCKIRKIDPLRRVLATADAWITGLRKEQSQNRQAMSLFEYDDAHELIKINPLIKWTYEDVFKEVKKQNIPYNVLHDKGYPSIGCEPCTRAIKPGEDFRAGRWWWENEDKKECGLHMGKD